MMSCSRVDATSSVMLGPAADVRDGAGCAMLMPCNCPRRWTGATVPDATQREWTYTLLALNCAVFEILSRIIAAEKIEWKIMFREISRSGIAPQPTLSTDETKASRRGDGAACAAPAGALPAQPASVALSVLPRARGDKYIVDSDNLIPKPSGVPIYSSL